MANWIKLFLDVADNSEFMEFEDAMREGKKSHKQKRIAEDIAFAQVVRLYLLLGQTKEGKINYRKTGDRLLAERVMRESGDDLILIFDRMAAHGVINYDFWTKANVITTTNAIEQANQRQVYKDRSEKGAEARRAKAAKRRAENLSGEP